MAGVMVDPRRVQYHGRGIQETGTGPVLYVMAREQRIADNWALLYAIERANQRRVPVIILFVVAPVFNHGSTRHNDWLLASLQECYADAAAHQLPFVVRLGEWAATVVATATEYAASEIVLDFNPLQPVRAWREQVLATATVPVAIVDAHNVVPCWVASSKAEFAAATFRPKIHRLLAEFLTKFPRVPTVLMPATDPFPVIDWEEVRAFRPSDPTVAALTATVHPGATAGLWRLRSFITDVLPVYHEQRNDPTVAATSLLSAYIRWGNVSAQRVAYEVQQALDAPREAHEAYLEELIVRRELADNYVYYTPQYDRVEAVHAWARATLAAHEADERTYVYTYEQFRDAQTHDDLWNAAQQQMVTEGWMHGYLRMYWAKKIFEWTQQPQEAINIALRLNDTYQLDGRDSNGVVGVMWSIGGVHDRAWSERPIFGKVRYMNYAGCKRKFDVAAFVRRYGETPATSLLLPQ